MAEPVTLYGIRNCSTVKKALVWLEVQDMVVHFHDYKKAGVSQERLESWTKELGWEALLNKSGTTFRKLPEADKENLDEVKALCLMMASPSLIRRPLIEWQGRIQLRFSPKAYEAFFQKT